ncbi:MAG: GNAT family N-acetyltransferase [Candidatus Eremiobacteraeota bacterium]|nr:GNAT family N-acetyltransferase [Candidatus Eremiobacteraeota bacterium]
MPTAIFRTQSTAQLEQLHELLIEYEESLPPDLRHGAPPDLRSLPLAYGGSNAAFLALEDDKAAGCIALTRFDASTGVMKRLYVKPAYRQFGIARALVAAVINFAREHRYRRVVLDTDRERLNAAYRLYASLGFSDCEPYAAVDYAKPTYMELRLQ